MIRHLRLDDLDQVAVPSQPALSSDGTRIVYTLRTREPEHDRMATALWIIDGTQAPRALTWGRADSDPAWSPDDEQLAFVRDNQIWLLDGVDAQPRQLTDLPLGAGAPVWSPDGSAIAFPAIVGADLSDPTAPIEVAGVDRLDGEPFLRGGRLQVHRVDVETGAVRQLTDEAHHVLEPAWSPDGRSIAVTAWGYVHEGLELGSVVQVVDAAEPRVPPTTVAFEHGLASTVTYTPDGAHLVVAGWTGRRRGHARLHLVDLATRSVTDLCPDIDRNVMVGEMPGFGGAQPKVVGDQVLFQVRVGGWVGLRAVPLTGGEPRILGREDCLMNGLSVGGDTAAVAMTTASSFGEIATIDLGTGTTTTRTMHGAALASFERFERIPRDFTISDGTRVAGWVVRAPSTTGPGPLVIDVHGGPHGAWSGALAEPHVYHQELVAAGWTVLLVNPRGSDGYGEAFHDGVHGAWGVADSADFLEPIDQLVAEGLADPERLAITGYSYGGFTTCYLTAHDDRFAAAVAGGMICDMTSLGGTSNEAHLMSESELGAFPWRAEDRGQLAAMSPYTFVERVTTPTLVLHGLDDLTCPVGQAQQWHSALRERGVETGLVLYPGAGHAFPVYGRPSHTRDYAQRLVAWLRQHA